MSPYPGALFRPFAVCHWPGTAKSRRLAAAGANRSLRCLRLLVQSVRSFLSSETPFVKSANPRLLKKTETLRVIPRQISCSTSVKGRTKQTRNNGRLRGTKRMSAMSRQRRYQLRHRRAGLCHECSRPVLSSGLFCEVHRWKRNLKNREWQRRKFKRKVRYRKAESYRFKGL
jgi:hypothetical protein